MAASKTRQILPFALMAILGSTGMVVAFGQTQLGRVELAQLGVDDSESSPEPVLEREAVPEANPFVEPLPADSQDESSAAPQDSRIPAAPPVIELTPDDYAAGWQQAGLDDDGLDSTTRRHILFVSPDGDARGRISLINPVTHALVPASDVTLTFLTPEGATAVQSVVETNGTFQLSGVPEGVFAVVGSGPSAFIAFAVQTIRTEGVPLSAADWSFDGAAVPQRDFPALTAILQAFDANDSRLPEFIEPPFEQIPEEAIDRGGWLPSEGTDRSLLATPIRHHHVALQADGRLLGRLRKLHPVTGRPLIARNLRVHAVLNGEIIESTVTSEFGSFVLERITPGVYSMIAEGPDGFVAFAIDVFPADTRVADILEGDEVALVNSKLEIDAATVGANLAQKLLQLSNQGQRGAAAAATAGTTGTPTQTTAPSETGSGGGGSSGSGTGTGSAGGGGFGGESGLFEALAAAGVIAAVAALANKDNKQNPVSPSSF